MYFQIYAKKGNLLTQCNPGDPYIMMSWVSAVLLPRTTTNAKQLISGQWNVLPKPQNLSSAACKNLVSFLTPQSTVWGKSFSCMNLRHWSLSPPISFFSISTERAPFPRGTMAFLSSSHLHTAYLPCSLPLILQLVSQIYFLGVRNILILIHLCSRDNESPGYPTTSSF